MAGQTGAYEARLECESYEANADLSAKQFYGVQLHTNGKAKLCATNGAQILGVLQNKPKANEAATVAQGGVSKVIAGVGGLTVGCEVAVENDGTFIIAASGDAIIGQCVVAAAAGALASIELGLLSAPTKA